MRHPDGCRDTLFSYNQTHAAKFATVNKKNRKINVTVEPVLQRTRSALNRNILKNLLEFVQSHGLVVEIGEGLVKKILHLRHYASDAQSCEIVHEFHFSLLSELCILP
jgi:hypothetical protein